MVREAARAGYPIRVAVIASLTDLGSVTELWNQPQLYARFLGQELSFVYRGPVLVVMPAGVGVNLRGSAPTTSPPASMAGLRVSASADLGAVAVSAVQRLAATSGVHLSIPRGASGPTTTSTDSAAWAALATGAVLIASAWAISLRARPPVLRRRTAARALEPPAAR